METILRAMLAKHGLDAIYATNPITVRYLSSFVGTNGSLLITKKAQYLLTDFRYLLVAKRLVSKKTRIIDTGTKNFDWRKLLLRKRIRDLGVEANFMNHTAYAILKKRSSGVRLLDTSRPLVELRMIKTAHELALIAKAQAITDILFSTLKKTIKIGMTEQDVAWLIEEKAHELGANTISFPPIVAYGANAASPHHQPTARKLKRGDTILIDMGVRYRGYCSDMTRMLFLKTPTPFQEKIYNTVREAQEKAEASIRAGMKGADADAIARGVIAKAGYGERFGHSLGHGIGLEVHEMPYASAKYPGALPTGTVITVEPGIYIDGVFGVRLEDMVVVKTSSVKNLTSSSKDIENCHIRG